MELLASRINKEQFSDTFLDRRTSILAFDWRRGIYSHMEFPGKCFVVGKLLPRVWKLPITPNSE